MQFLKGMTVALLILVGYVTICPALGWLHRFHPLIGALLAAGALGWILSRKPVIYPISLSYPRRKW